MPCRVAADTNQVGGDFHWQLATFDNAELYLGSEIQLYTLLFIFESLGSTYMYCYRNCLHNYNFIN